MEMWGVRQSILYRLLVAIKGQHDATVASWTRSVLISSSSASMVNPDEMNPLWFDKPLLAMPLLDALALYLSASKFTSPPRADSANQTLVGGSDLAMLPPQGPPRRHADSSAVKWICVAYLVQCFVAEINELENRKPPSEENDSALTAAETALPVTEWDIAPLFRVLFETVLLTKEELQGGQTIWKTPLELSPSATDGLYKRILLKWLVFVRVAVRMTKRCDPELFGELKWNDEAITVEALSVTNLTHEMVMNALHQFRLREILSLPGGGGGHGRDVSVITIAALWLRDLFRTGPQDGASCHEDCVRFNQWHYPVHTIPSFVELPDAYTKLHGQITSRCAFEYPAFCFVCGEILDAGETRPSSLLSPVLSLPQAGREPAHDTLGSAGAKLGFSSSCRSLPSSLSSSLLTPLSGLHLPSPLHSEGELLHLPIR
jgi:hypothetical protein